MQNSASVWIAAPPAPGKNAKIVDNTRSHLMTTTTDRLPVFKWRQLLRVKDMRGTPELSTIRALKAATGLREFIQILGHSKSVFCID